jgi:hypothetical protein
MPIKSRVCSRCRTRCAPRCPNAPPPPPVRPRLACCLCTPLPSMQHHHRTVPSTLAQVRLLQNPTPDPTPDPNPTQVRLLQNIRHEHIVAFVAALSLPGGNFCYLQEFARGGTLDAAIRRQRTLATPFASTVVARWTRQLATVMLAGGSTHRPRPSGCHGAPARADPF